MTLHQQTLTVTAIGEVRDADGNLLGTPEATVTVAYEEFRDAVLRDGITDDQLRALGVDEQIITQIRSDT